MLVSARVFRYCLIIAIVAMLVSIISKRSVPFGGSILKSSTVKSIRSFSYTSSSSNGGEGGDYSSWSSHGSSKSYSTSSSSSSFTNPNAQSTSSPPVTTSTASLNYDSALTTFSNYSVAVAYQPKDRKPSSNMFKKSNRSPALDSPSGEDNLFVSSQVSDGSIAVGVADGVGGWSEAGYDSSAISRELCSNMRKGFESAGNASTTPKSVLDNAFKEVLQSEAVEIGGTTACLGVFTPDLKLRVANLGDSWCGLFREYRLVKETNFQTHNFNTPYQLAKIPQHILRKAAMEGRRYIIDEPKLADEYSWDLQKGDIVMFATDGVTDNVVPKDIEIFLKDHLEDKKDAKLNDVAKKFVSEVVKVSKDGNFPSAFAQELSRLTGQKYLGGKEDDITVVLVKVV
ncbi:PTC7 [Candida theae]|uniref:Protein phosphatase n=1 Tax=Candida theae TaxID=1198502 RepID=A0AAD5BGD3_9ASCO|nr:PTC7 [Candida theae]KAI5959360.1 PTC7 [Candida theae]